MTAPRHASPPWWSPDRHADRRPLLAARGAIRGAVRRWFEDQGFTEVECGALQVSPGAETHIHAFATHRVEPDGAARTLYLHSSPEPACKKLLAAGEQRIFELARVYRNRERGPLHAPEFTLLEWYRAEAPFQAVIDDALAICRRAGAAIGAKALTYRNRRADLDAPPERLSVAAAFAEHAGVDLFAVLGDRDLLAGEARRIGVRAQADDDWSDLFSRILVERIEPRLGEGRLTILHDYPLAEAALARPCAGDPRFAERFELYACGVELANGFGELTDPVEQRRRFEAAMAEKLRRYGERYPLDEDFLEALSIMPPASGCALGFDRLVMLCLGAPRIEDVIWTPTP
jgi:lysyl-tRNA synthetase class 2